MNEITRLLHEPLVFRLGLTLVHFVWQGVAFGLLALLALLALRRARPATRYLALLVLFALMAASPVVTYSLTKREPKPFVITKAAMGRLMAETAKVHALSRAGTAPSRPQEPFSHAARVKLLRAWRWVRLRLPVGVMLWSVGVLLLALRLLLRWRALSRVRARAAALDTDHAAQVLAMVAGRLGVRRTVRLLESALVRVPTVMGWLRPAILLPPCALTGLTPAQLEAVIAHEVAHIRRHDFLVNILQTVVETLLFYHPVVWWLSGRIRAEREHCCDDLAVMVSGDAVSYARALAEMERLRPPAPALALADGPLKSRVRRLVAPGSESRPLAPWFSAALPALAVVFFLLAPVLTRMASASSLEGTLIYTENLNSPDDGRGNEIDVVTHVLRGQEEWVIPEGTVRQGPWAPDFSPVTGEVVYSYGSCRDDKGIWKANPDGSDPIELTRVEGVGGVNCWPKWSPDGSMVSFSHMEPPPGKQPSLTPVHSWVMNADGSGAHQVTELAEKVGGTWGDAPSWSPDSSRLLICTRSEHNAYGVTDKCGRRFTADVRTGEVRVLPGTTRGAGVFSPDGSTIAGCTSEAATLDGKAGEWHQVVLTDQDGGRRQILFEWFVSSEEVSAYHPGDATWPKVAAWTIGPHNLVWSPRGDKLAFVAAMPYDPSLTKGVTCALHSVNEQWDVFVCDSGTGQVTRITDDRVGQSQITWWQ